jgi:hypothetical protein
MGEKRRAEQRQRASSPTTELELTSRIEEVGTYNGRLHGLLHLLSS